MVRYVVQGLILLFISCLPWAACTAGAAGSQTVANSSLPPLKIAASIDNTPFHFADENGRAVGIFIDLWRLWSRKTGRKVEFIARPWSQSLEMVRTGAADIHAGCFYSVKRDQYLDYANELRPCQTHFFFHDTIYGLKDLKDLKGFEIGVLERDYAAEFVKRELPGAALKLYSSHRALFEGVKAGDIKVFICDTPTALYFLTRSHLISRFRYHPSRPLYKKPFFAAVRQGNMELIDQINKGLSAITTRERAAIERKWMGQAPAQPRQRLVIGLDQSFAPLSMRSANGEPSGFLADYWRAWAAKTGQQAVIRLYDRQEGVQALKDGIVDILSTFPPSGQIQGWTETCDPIYRLDWYLYQTAPLDAPSSGQGFKDKNIGALKYSRVSEWLKFQDIPPDVTEFDTTMEMILAAGQHKIDGFLATAQEMAVLPGQMGIPAAFYKRLEPVFRMKIRPGIRHYNPGLIAAIDAGFRRMSQSEKFSIESKWIQDTSLRVYRPGSNLAQLTDEEDAWLTAHRLSGIPIRLYVHQDLMPFERFGPDGTFQGMVSDVASLLEKRLGLSFEPVAEPHGQNPEDNDPDAVSAAFPFESRKPWMAYTRPYMHSPRVIITTTQSPIITGLMDMAGKTLACIGTDPCFKQVKQRWPDIQLTAVHTVMQGLQMVLEDEADGYLGNLALAAYQIQASHFTALKVAAAAAIDDADLSFAVRSNRPELLSILNKGIETISPQELDQIRQKWFTVRFDHDSDLVLVRTMVKKIAAAGGLVFVLVLFWNRMIRRREERFRCLTEHGTDIIHAFSPDGQLIYASPSHTTVLGYPARQIKKCRVFDLIHPEDVPGFKQMLDTLKGTGGTATRIYRIRHFSGNALFFESNCMDLMDNKAIKAFVVNGRDITDALKTRQEIETAKEAAEAANRKKSDFLAGLSHEIRTPLNAILGMTEMTLKTCLDDTQSRNLNAVLLAARHLKAVISDILDFSTIEAGKMKIFNKNFRIDTLLDNLAHIWQAEAAAKGLEFKLETDDLLPPGVRSDPVRLNQILTNLLSNAVKFTPKGTVTLAVTVVPGNTQPDTQGRAPALFEDNGDTGEKRRVNVAFKVSDTGIGIAKGHVRKIFRRFTQAQGSITREYGGTGLGLSLCREMAVMLGGNIDVDSTPGSGSSFTLTLPLIVLPDLMKPAESGPQGPLPAVRELNLVLAEDDPVNRAVFREMAGPLNCRIKEAENGEQAIEILKSFGADLIFMDLEMPKMDGLTACRSIREGHAGKAVAQVPVVAMTAHVLDEYRSLAAASGMDEFIAKPVEYNQLIQLLNKYAVQKTLKKLNTRPGVPIDRQKALSALGGNEVLLDKIIDIFIVQTPALVSDLKSAVASGDAKQVALAAHTLKGAAKRVYANAAARAASDLETLARDAGKFSAHQDGITSQAGRTIKTFTGLIQWLKHDKSRNSRPAGQ